MEQARKRKAISNEVGHFLKERKLDDIPDVEENSSDKHHKKGHRLDYLLARPSSVMCKRLRNQIDTILDAEVTEKSKIRTMCIFCEESYEVNFNEWKDHLLVHTGETEPSISPSRNQFKPEQFRSSSPALSLLSSTSSSLSGSSKNYSNFQNESDLKGFLCKFCDCLQVYENHLIEHVIKDHKLKKPLDYVEKVTLIPNLLRKLEPIQGTYNCVDMNSRYLCGVQGCLAQYGTQAEFRKHFIRNHREINVFPCPHCKLFIKNVKNNDFFSDIFNHLNMHGKFINECILCYEQFSNDFDIISHLFAYHTTKESFVYRHDYRDRNRIKVQCEVIVIIECSLCQASFESLFDANRHYLNVHQSHNSNFALVRLTKNKHFGGDVIKYAMLESERIFLIQRHFSCDLCMTPFKTKGRLIKHHQLQHPDKEIAIQFNKHVLDTEKTSKLTSPPDFDEYLIYQCYYCMDKSKRSIYADVDDVYEHWSSHHDKKLEVFRFSVSHLAFCRYCDVVSTFEGLKKHRLACHSHKEFSIENIFDRTKCALCPTSAEDPSGFFAEHYEKHHRLALKLDDFNPITFNNDILHELIQLKGQKKYNCTICSQFFYTKDEANVHFIIKHPADEKEIIHTYDNQSIHLITGCCQANIDIETFLDHVKQHSNITNNSAMAVYWLTKAVFGNGLVLNMHNLRGTKFDHSQQFYDLF